MDFVSTCMEVVMANKLGLHFIYILSNCNNTVTR